MKETFFYISLFTLALFVLIYLVNYRCHFFLNYAAKIIKITICCNKIKFLLFYIYVLMYICGLK